MSVRNAPWKRDSGYRRNVPRPLVGEGEERAVAGIATAEEAAAERTHYKAKKQRDGRREMWSWKRPRMERNRASSTSETFGFSRGPAAKPDRRDVAIVRV